MRRWYCGAVVVALGCLALAGCAAAPTPIPPRQAVLALRAGEPLLRCREACVEDWRRAQPQAAQLAAASDWADLAALVEQVGYQDDLTLYYLARAAEGLGYPGAAASYYRQSLSLSGTSISCANLSRMCGGVALPRAAASRLAAIDRELGRQLRRPARPVPHPTHTPAKAGPPLPGDAVPPPPAETGASHPGDMPPPTPLLPPAAPIAPAAAGVTAPAPEHAPSGASDYIEPPPALH